MEKADYIYCVHLHSSGVLGAELIFSLGNNYHVVLCEDCADMLVGKLVTRVVENLAEAYARALVKKV